MVKLTPEMKCWMGKFGAEYTDRNTLSLDELDKFYLKNYGISRTALNKEFLKDTLVKSSRVLEIGSNIANQLLMLQRMGFNNLYRIELQSYAVELSKQRTNKINLIQGSALNIPFKDAFFDLVFTSGLLIHINPKNIKEALKEIYRCTKNYIWGFEYWSDDYSAVTYRGNKELLWKTDFAKLYLETFDDLVIVKQKKIGYVDNNKIDLRLLPLLQ